MLVHFVNTNCNTTAFRRIGRTVSYDVPNILAAKCLAGDLPLRVKTDTQGRFARGRRVSNLKMNEARCGMKVRRDTDINTDPISLSVVRDEELVPFLR